MVLALAAPLAARAADPGAVEVAQAGPSGVPGIAAPTSPENQSARPGNNTTGDQTLETPSIPTSEPPRIGLFPQFGKTLLDAGIDLHGIAFDHFLANPSAGIVRGQQINLAAFRPSVDLDLGKLIGLSGGNVHVGLSFFGLRADQPQSLTQLGGFLTGFQTTPVTQTNLVSLLTYEQRFLGDRFSVEVGRTNVFNYFLLPNSLDPFTHYSGTFQINGDFNSVPYPVWGSRATYKLTPKWYLQGGAFEDDYRDAVNYGDRFGTGQASGAQLLAEVGYRSEFSNAAYPANLEAGFEWNTRTGRSNLKGTGAPAIPLLQGANYPGGGVIYMQGEQVLWRGARRVVGPPANVALYGSLDVSVDKPQPIDMDAMAGVNLTGFVPTRPFDALGLQVKYQRLSQVEVNQENFRQRLLARLAPGQQRNGFAFEAVGNIQVTPAFAFRPLVEYFLNPDNYYPPAPPGRPHDGYEVGFFAVVSLGRLLGTSVKPF
jgi:porin